MSKGEADMRESYSEYCILQYSPRPERFEYLNVGVIVVDRRRQISVPRFLKDVARIRRSGGDLSGSFILAALEDFTSHLTDKLMRLGGNLTVEGFNSKNVGIFRITELMPVLGADLGEVADKLFDDLVAIQPHRSKGERVGTRLTFGLRQAGVLSLLERNPDPVLIEKWGVSLRADYGYQNGAYNLIDSARFDDPERGLAEAGKRVLEARALAEGLEHRLIVVAEFGEQSPAVVRSLKEEFLDAKATLYSIEEVGLLSEEIRRTAH